MSYAEVAEFARSWGLVYLVVLFAIVLFRALRPRNRKKFEEAARIPLRED